MPIVNVNTAAQSAAKIANTPTKVSPISNRLSSGLSVNQGVDRMPAPASTIVSLSGSGEGDKVKSESLTYGTSSLGGGSLGTVISTAASSKETESTEKSTDTGSSGTDLAAGASLSSALNANRMTFDISNLNGSGSDAAQIRSRMDKSFNDQLASDMESLKSMQDKVNQSSAGFHNMTDVSALVQRLLG